MKQRKALYAKLDQVPLDVKTGMMAQAAGATRWTFSISYVNNRRAPLKKPLSTQQRL
jgi:hypothetical protein